MRVDLGCADRPKGDVNVDIARVSVESGFEVRGSIRTKANLLADLNNRFLPFADDSVEEITCHDVIEHVENPFRFLSEIVRVLAHAGKADLRCPHRFGVNAKKLYHRSFFSCSWFTRTLSKLPCSFRVTTLQHGFFPFLPNEIQVEIWKHLAENALFVETDNGSSRLNP